MNAMISGVKSRERGAREASEVGEGADEASDEEMNVECGGGGWR